MHDINAIRKTPEAFDKNWGRRGLSAQTPQILKLDEERREAQTLFQAGQARKNSISKEIGLAKSKGLEVKDLMEKASIDEGFMSAAKEKEEKISADLNELLSSLPNLLDDEVPEGADEHANVELRKHGEIKTKSGPDHVAIGEALGMMDFDVAAKMSGSRFVLMHSGLAKMERALAQFMLELHTTEHGYTEVSPPLLVNSNALFGTGQLPKFGDDLFRIMNKTEKEVVDQYLNRNLLNEGLPDQLAAQLKKFYPNKINALIGLDPLLGPTRYLIPTSEVSLTNMVADTILEDDGFPKRYTAFTPCFRSEAGAAGKDTKGMIRQHQFYKVEMVSITTPEQSKDEHERMTQCAENVLKKLGLPFRTIILCAGDIGFGARRTYDIEVWLPGQERYREISSCSNCGDFQARRMKARYRPKGEKETRFVHTLNGSGLAVGRTLIAVLENYYDPADGGVFVPEVLKPYMGGMTKILPLK